MGATLEALHHLQEIELQLADVHRVIDRKLRKCKKQQDLIAEIDGRIGTLKKELQAGEIEADSCNLDVKAVEDEIAKYRVALNTSKTNKEYSAALTQLNTFKADNSKNEERLLEIMSRNDTRSEELASVEEQRVKELEKLTAQEEIVRASREQSRDKLERLEREREEAAAAVPPKVLEMFSRVAKKHDGEAMAKIVRTHPKRQEYACGGCNMSITIEQVNTVLSRDEAVLCNVCGHILYQDTAAASQAR